MTLSVSKSRSGQICMLMGQGQMQPTDEALGKGSQ